MTNMRKFILKKRNIWFHIIMTYITCFIWPIIYFYTKSKNKKTKPTFNIQFKEKNNVTAEFIKNNNEVWKGLATKNHCNDLVNDYIVVDIETTGLSPSYDRITEIAGAKYKNGVLIETFNELINPGIDIPPKITQITGITNSMVQNKDSVDIVLPQFIKFIEDYTLVLHNAPFDIDFIAYNLSQSNIQLFNNKIIDTLPLSRMYGGFEKNSLEYIKNHFQLTYNSHRALDDCYTTNYLYDYLKNKKK